MISSCGERKASCFQYFFRISNAFDIYNGEFGVESFEFQVFQNYLFFMKIEKRK